jgi:hypothetical protein
VSERRLGTAIAACGFVFVTSAVALGAHTMLALGQSLGVLGGDYGAHAHATVLPVGLAGFTLALCAAFSYIVHIASAGRRSLPSLARAFRRCIDWRKTVLLSVSAASLLAAMESAEQALGGHFDGPGAAFGATPVAGFAVVLVASAVAVALARSVCDWLASAHSRIAMVVACLLRPMYSFALPAAWRTKRHALTTVDYVWDTSLAHGKRGPPRLLAA